MYDPWFKAIQHMYTEQKSVSEGQVAQRKKKETTIPQPKILRVKCLILSS